MSNWIDLGEAGQIPSGKMKRFEIASRAVAVANLEGNYYGWDDVCPHAGAVLSEGTLQGNFLRCPWHGARFDVTTGKGCGGPAMDGLKTYPVRVEKGIVQVALE